MSGAVSNQPRAIWLASIWASVAAACAGPDRTAYPTTPALAADPSTAAHRDGGQSSSAPAPPTTARPPIPLPGNRGAFAKAVEDALPAVRRFVRSSGQDAAVAAGEALAALGRAIETLPDPAGTARADIKEINFEAQRLHRSERLSFGVAKWIKLGLAAAIDALDKLSPPGGAKSFWIRAAREAQDAIDASTTATFQRAALQDALRSTVTAFVIVGQGLEVCR